MSNKKERGAYGAQLRQQHRTNDRRAWRKAHLERQGARCHFCKNPLKFADATTTRINRAAGGADTEANTVAACKSCNKGDHS